MMFFTLVLTTGSCIPLVPKTVKCFGAMRPVGGYLSSELGQPAVAVEVLVGLILGPSVLNFLH